MRRLLGPIGWPAAFLLTVALVCAVLGWVTVAALRVERAQREAAARAELGNNLRVALWRLDGRMLPVLGVEDSRPYHHYTSPDPHQGSTAGPTPLLAAELPDWMKLHVQLDPAAGWGSPQVLEPAACARVADAWPDLPLRNNTAERAGVLAEVKAKFPSTGTWSMLCARDSAAPADERPLAAPLFDPLTPAPAPAAPGNGVAANPKPPPPDPAVPEPFRLLGWDLPRPADDRVASKSKKESADSPPTAQSQLKSQGQQTAGHNSARTADDRNEYRNRSDTISRGMWEAKGAAQEFPYAGKGNSLTNDRGQQAGNGINFLPNYSAGVPGSGDKDARGNTAPLDQLQVQKDAESERARDLLKKLQAEQFREFVPDEQRPPAQTVASNSLAGNVANFAGPPLVSVHLGSMRPQWIVAADGSETLVLVRAAKLNERTVYQGVILDWPKLEGVLKDEVRDLFPGARLVPVKDGAEVSPDRAMTALPVQLDPGDLPEPPPAGWTPLRLGLALAWVAALVVFAAVGFSGWTLLDLAERRIRFVSAVTHELRTPLTSLRLYLDLLMSGMIHDEAKRQEYLNTLATESDRLHRLIDNVLDFAKLEKRAKNGDTKPLKVAELVEQLRSTWSERVAADGKELVVVSTLPADVEVCTDAAMVQQIVSNLIDNARKYTRDASDARIWLWVKPGGTGRVVFEVEDRGAGVPVCERKTIFKPFRRGEHADTTAGGAGLGLALAKQWAEVLGGTLTYRPAEGAPGACFRLELPVK